MADPAAAAALAGFSSVLAVCAHPDDESFGLGAVLDVFSGLGARASVLCFTHGEASTLGSAAYELEALRADELTRAAAVLGVQRVVLLDHPDGRLEDVPLADLTRSIEEVARDVKADLLLVFDKGGITGHPDHERTTRAALEARVPVPVLAWAVPLAVASVLSAETGTSFVGRDEGETDLRLTVDRSRQMRAIACHESQATGNRVLQRRLELTGSQEYLRWLRPPVQ